jgi:uncharacterized membrane protein
MNTLINHTPRFKQLLALTLAACLPAGLVLFRVAYTDSIRYSFLLWNLFLAWLPLLFAWFARYIEPKSRLLALVSVAAWLAFLPNAPYLITDIAHLHPVGDIPYFYDVVMFFSLALTGVVLGFASLAWLQEAVEERLGLWPGRLFAAIVIAMASYGVYLGRFLRWNSWDVLAHPFQILFDVLHIAYHPVANFSILAHSAMLTVMLIFAYALLSFLPNFSGKAFSRELS